MKLALDIMQAAGLGAACGISPFLALLAAGGLARAKLGVSFEGTPYAFLQSSWFLLADVIAYVVVTLTRHWWTGTRADLLATGGVAAGVLLGAGSLADNHYSAAVGGIVAGVCAVIAALATRDLLTRVRARLDAQAAGALPLYTHAASAIAAVLAILVPPVSILIVGFLLWLLVGGRRRSQEKYAGLRSLR